MNFELNYNFYNTLIFSGIVYGIVFSFVILTNRKYSSLARDFLVFTVLSMTLSNLQYWLIDVGFRERFNVPKVYYLQFELLIIPFFYLFTRKFLGKNVSRNHLVLVLTPFFLGMTYQILMYALEIKKPQIIPYNLIVEIITICFSLFLLILVFRNIHIYERKYKSGLKRKIKSETKWLKNTLILGILVYTLWIFGTQLFYFTDFKSFKSYYPLWIGISVIIYWIGNKGVIELRIIKERQTIRDRSKTAQSTIQNNQVITISKDKGAMLFEKIVADIENNTLFLEPNISLDKVAERHNISSGYLSHLIGKYSRNGFADIINGFRINAAKKMLINNAYEKYTIDSIALESGFNTKSNFYSVFKKQIGLTPNQFKKSTKS